MKSSRSAERRGHKLGLNLQKMLCLKSNCNANIGDKTLTEVHRPESEHSSGSTSLARQRSMEDDEEFEKARRRRTRLSNSAPNHEEIAEEQHTSENSTRFNDQEETSSPSLEDETVPFAEMLRRREEDKRRHQRETLQSLKLAKFASETEVEKESTGKQENENQKPDMQKAVNNAQWKKSDEDCRKKIDELTIKEKEANNSVARKQNHSGKENACSQSPLQSPLSPVHTTRAFISLGRPKEVKSPTRLKTQLSFENDKCYQQENSSTLIANDCFRPQAKSTEPKMGERRECEQTRQEPPKRESVRKAGTQEVKRTSAVITQIRHQKNETSSEDSNSNAVPFCRLTARATSFRVSNSEVKSQPFQRSASLRIPKKIDDRLEQYTKAIQRSDSRKAKQSPSNYLTRPLEGVASKRCVFEKEDAQDSSARHYTSRKEAVGLYVRVAVRINQWVTRAQESRKTFGCKDIRPGDVANKRNLWENKADSLEKKELHAKGTAASLGFFTPS
ncbi:non-muscle caldesmon-like isoform X2 [Hemiscyllium ocellatum]|uniref:non-muscle caldesmon-like isoform X2 n=1 Tax=Hemiscyllium ocellatum TaxID=170820 RepID=UPI002966F152|nr:non-muscle caldesmon-like isoform X2 [Hemiscyllium ocellatum]